jgi:hypothetical protein
MNPVLRGEEDLPQDYLSGFHKKAFNRRQTLNSSVGIKLGTGKPDSLQSLSTLEKSSRFRGR